MPVYQQTLWAKSGVALLLLVSAQVSLAFDADLHRAYTRQAAEAWRGCAGVELPDRAVQALANGTEAEDISVATAVQRVTHWHFYNREGKLQPAWFAHRNIDRIFALRVERLEQLLAQDKPDHNEVYEQAGRVLHYIQDMSVPAHVVPVFHMAGMGDDIDSFQAPSGFSLSQEQCRQLGDETDTAENYLNSLLQEAAESTLAAIDADAGWQQYWSWPARDAAQAAKGWGEYGPCRFSRGPDVPGCKREAEIEAFFAARYQHTLLDSIRVMAYLSRRLQRG